MNLPSRSTLSRASTITLVTFLALGSVIWAFSNILGPILVWLVPTWRPTFYDLGIYGPYAVTKYISTNIEAPALSIPFWNDVCDDGRHILFTPKGSYVAQSGPTIMTPRGELIWMSSEYRNAMNLNIQTYKGDRYLTFWTGDKAATSGQGVYLMLDSSYTLQHTIQPHGATLHADLHEFQITSADTALLTIYDQTTITDGSMTFLNRPVTTGYLTESAFQEINITTGDLLFEWRASEHFSLNDSYYWAPLDGLRPSRPLDWFHINSLKKDSDGNYLVSSRHLHMVCCVSGKNGKVLWTLGGKKNDFRDLSDGRATNFQWQHDARWVDEASGTLTIYDNGDAGPVQTHSGHSRGIMLQLDVKAKTVKLLHEYVSMAATSSASQGSVQVLPDQHGEVGKGDVFVGWGHSAMFSEFTNDGALLCEWHFGPSWLDFPDFVASYRALKMEPWVGRPRTKPLAKVARGSRNLYVSWNGATEVKTWSLQATRYYGGQSGRGDEGEYEEIDVMQKQGFEDIFVLPHDFADYASIRVVALDVEGQLLAFSDTVRETEAGNGWLFGGSLLFTVVLILGFVLGSWIFYVKVVRKEELR
ncbi:uncharacterized protein AB675_12184, partial [Cyphellophora attinorum]